MAMLTWLGFGGLAIALKNVLVMEAEILRWRIGLLAYMVFGAALLRLIYCQHDRESTRFRLALVACLTVSAMSLAFVLPGCGAVGILLIVPAAVAARLLHLPLAAIWIFAQSIVFAGLLLKNSFWNNAVPWIAGTTSFQLFALLSSFIAANEARARTELAELNAELKETRALLAEASRNAERIRIARDLHDAVGHHLTALSLNLEAASHTVPTGQAQLFVDQAKGITKNLLSEVRVAVSQMHNLNQPFDITSELRALIRQLPNTEIFFFAPPHLQIADFNASRVAFRCAQELLTNSLRHAEAQHVWLELQEQNNGLCIQLSDDGKGVEGLQEGNGLRGMRSQLSELGGHIYFEKPAHGGFLARAWIPLSKAAGP